MVGGGNVVAASTGAAMLNSGNGANFAFPLIGSARAIQLQQSGSGRAAQPAVTLGISKEALDMIARLGATSTTLPGNGAGVEKLLGVAVLTALMGDGDKEGQKKSSSLASALIMSAAVQAYQQVAGFPGASVMTPVLGAGVSISVSAGVGL